MKMIPFAGYRVARIRVLFRLPPWFRCSDILAYVEWFSSFGPPVMPLRMSKVTYSLTPIFGDPARKQQNEQTTHWNSQNVMEECSNFFFNSQISLQMFQVADGDYVLNRSLYTTSRALIVECYVGLHSRGGLRRPTKVFENKPQLHQRA